MKYSRTPISTGLDNSIILKYQPILSQYYPSGWSNYSVSITESEYLILQALKNQGKNLRKFCTPLTLEDDGSGGVINKTISFTGTKSAEDTINRMMWVIKTTAVGGTETFTIQGTDDESTENWDDITSINVTTATTMFNRIDKIYKYYRVNYSGTSASYTTYLVEISFFFAHLYKTLELIYRMLSASPADDYWIKADYYNNQYHSELNNMLATYDEDLSESVDTAEEQYKVSVIQLMR